jgi:beta-glucanase (GH16 family)
VERGSDYITWAYDGKPFFTLTADSPEKPIFYPDVPFYLIINTAVGGPWPHPPNASTIFPTVHSVDYVRISTK